MVSRRLVAAYSLLAVPYFPSAIRFLQPLVVIFTPTLQTGDGPRSSSSDSEDQWELRCVLLLWLQLLLTIPFPLTAFSASQLPKTAPSRLFPTDFPPLAQTIATCMLPLLHQPGKEGTYAALILARLYARSDAARGLEPFFEYLGSDIEDGERENETHLVASTLQLLAFLPPLLAVDHLTPLARFMDEMLLPHLRGSQTVRGSGLIRKMAIKAKGRWWLRQLEGSPDPLGIEGEIEDLLSGLADKVCMFVVSN